MAKNPALKPSATVGKALPERPPKERIDEILNERDWAMEHLNMRYQARRDYLQLCAEIDHLRAALNLPMVGHIEAIIRKCEQYWNEPNLCDAEVHAALEIIHGEAQAALRPPAEKDKP